MRAHSNASQLTPKVEAAARIAVPWLQPLTTHRGHGGQRALHGPAEVRAQAMEQCDRQLVPRIQ